MTSLAMRLLERNLVPDFLIRRRIRALLAGRLREESQGDPELQRNRLVAFVRKLAASPVAIETAAANQQHYEVPTDFYTRVLGKHLKYSSGYYQHPNAAPAENLDAAEARMLALTCQRARLADGERILELGCGWGSLSLWMAANYPAARITAVSNSRTQNYETLLARVASWMAPGATLFVHIFTHCQYAYPFEVRDESDWMARYFFTGGIMPSDDLLLYFQRDVRILDHWHVPGWHYSLTSEAWLSNMDQHRAELMPLLARTYGTAQALRWWVYWRVFFMSCAELWGYDGGREWLVSHYLFGKR